MLRDRKRSQVWPVMLAEPLPDRETSRLLDAMKALGAGATAIFVNRVIFVEDAGDCPRCTLATILADADARRNRKAVRIGSAKIYVIFRNRPFEIAGKKALKEFTQELWQLA